MFFDIYCNDCAGKMSRVNNFINKPAWLFIETNESQISIEELPRTLVIENLKYNLLCSTIKSNYHFQSLFLLNGTMHLIDCLKPTTRVKTIPKHKCNTIVYYLNN